MSSQIKSIQKAFQFRHACKEFDPNRTIPEAEINCILEAARLSPSSFGLEPWQFLVIQNPAIREQLRTVTWGGQKQLPTASHLVLTLARKKASMRFDSAYVDHLMRDVQHYPEEIITLRKNYLEQFQKHDFDLMGNERAFNEWCLRQTYIPLTNMMTIAAMLDIDSCPIEGFDQKAIDNMVSKLLDIDLTEWGVAYLVSFGYRIADPRPQTRQPASDVIRWID
jgi:nitroreductase